ncbi:MAG: hypothetical protein K5666_04030 [Bacilli bacterium]|nr:hypothetical protein [Bacilli bacterium]
MRYYWKKRDLIKLKNELSKVKSKKNLDDISNINEMLGILSDDIDLDYVDIMPVDEKFDFNLAYTRFLYGLENYSERMLDSLLYLFQIDQDGSFYEAKNILSTFKIPNKDLLLLGLDCISELHDDKLIDFYKELVNNENHLLHILNGANFVGLDSKLYGVTFYLRNLKQSYVAIMKDNCWIDFQTLIHEVMHAYFNKFLGYRRGRGLYFGELEGRLGNLLATKYLQNNGLEEYANEIDEFDFRSALSDSYDLYLNDLLFGTCLENSFDMDIVKSKYKEELGRDWIFDEEETKDLCHVYGFNKCNDLLCYLMLLDLDSKGYNAIDLYNKVKYFKKNDTRGIIDNLNKMDITFMDDGYKHARALYDKVKNRS